MEWLHKRVRVHLKDGGALEGTVEHIDLAGNQLSLSSAVMEGDEQALPLVKMEAANIVRLELLVPPPVPVVVPPPQPPPQVPAAQNGSSAHAAPVADPPGLAPQRLVVVPGFPVGLPQEEADSLARAAPAKGRPKKGRMGKNELAGLEGELNPGSYPQDFDFEPGLAQFQREATAQPTEPAPAAVAPSTAHNGHTAGGPAAQGNRQPAPVAAASKANQNAHQNANRKADRGAQSAAQSSAAAAAAPPVAGGPPSPDKPQTGAASLPKTYKTGTGSIVPVVTEEQMKRVLHAATTTTYLLPIQLIDASGRAIASVAREAAQSFVGKSSGGSVRVGVVVLHTMTAEVICAARMIAQPRVEVRVHIAPDVSMLSEHAFHQLAILRQTTARVVSLEEMTAWQPEVIVEGGACHTLPTSEPSTQEASLWCQKQADTKLVAVISPALPLNEDARASFKARQYHPKRVVCLGPPPATYWPAFRMHTADLGLLPSCYAGAGLGDFQQAYWASCAPNIFPHK